MRVIEDDFKELLQLFDKHRVKYCIVGGHAVGLYAIPRYTKDLDLFIQPDAQNAERVLQALSEFGFSCLDVKIEDIASPGATIQLGYEPVRIDLLTEIAGCSFSEVWRGRRRGKFGDLRATFIGLRELIQNKQASDRLQDRADVEALRAMQRRKGRKRVRRAKVSKAR